MGTWPWTTSAPSACSSWPTMSPTTGSKGEGSAGLTLPSRVRSAKFSLEKLFPVPSQFGFVILQPHNSLSLATCWLVLLFPFCVPAVFWFCCIASGTLWVLCRAFSILGGGVDSSLLDKHPEKAHLAVPSRDNGKWKPDQHSDVWDWSCGVALFSFGIVQSLLTAFLWALGSLQRIPAVPVTWIFPSLAEL